MCKSKILDNLLISNANSNDVLQFIQANVTDVYDMFNQSLNISKLFNVNFLKTLKAKQVKELFDLVLSQKKLLKSYCFNEMFLFSIWQILKTNGYGELKYVIRRYTDELLKISKVHHLYSQSISPSIVQDFDNYMLKNDTAYDKLANISANNLSKIVCNSTKSLFKYSIFQYDFFNSLTDVNKFIFLNVISDNIENTSIYSKSEFYKNPIYIIKFFLSILQYETNMQIVKLTYDKLVVFTKKYASISRYNNKFNEFYELINKYESYEELMLIVALNGLSYNSYDKQLLAYCMIIYNKIDMLKSWNSYEPNELNSLFDVNKFLNSKIYQ